MAELRDQISSETNLLNDGFYENTLYYDSVPIFDWFWMCELESFLNQNASIAKLDCSQENRTFEPDFCCCNSCGGVSFLQ